MNIKDTEAVGQSSFPSSDGDKLDRIFQSQKRLMEKYKPISEVHFGKVFGGTIEIDPKAWEGGETNLHTKTGNFLIEGMINSTIHELSEAMQTLKNWKSWKQTEMETDVDHFREEVADALHFFVEMCIFAGITPDDLYDLYTKKNQVNQFRQRSKY